MKFSIRDLFLVTLVVAVCVAWWLDRSRLHSSWKAAELESQKFAAAYKESGRIMVEIVEALQKRGVVTSTVRGKTAIGPESAFAPYNLPEESIKLRRSELELHVELPNSSAPAPNPPKP